MRTIPCPLWPFSQLCRSGILCQIEVYRLQPAQARPKRAYRRTPCSCFGIATTSGCPRAYRPACWDMGRIFHRSPIINGPRDGPNDASPHAHPSSCTQHGPPPRSLPPQTGWGHRSRCQIEPHRQEGGMRLSITLDTPASSGYRFPT